MMERLITDMKSWIYAISLVLGGMTAGCYYDVDDKLYPNDCNTENVTYRGTIVPILERNCYTCHDAFSRRGGVNLEGYDQLFPWLANQLLIDAIDHSGKIDMPKNGVKLDSCTIAKFEIWLDDGAPNN